MAESLMPAPAGSGGSRDGRGHLTRRAVLTGAAAVGFGSVLTGFTRPATAPGVHPQAEALRTAFATAAKELLTPGAAMLVASPEGRVTATYGTRSLHGHDPLTLSDHERIGSLTKTMTGTVILQLAQEGRIDVDAPVSRYYPGVPNGRAITIAQLLDMRSGLFNYTETVELNRTLDQHPTKAWRPEELLKLGFARPPYFAPGKGYHYSNTNTILLGLIAERVGRRPLGEAFRKRLFAPLGMRRTVFPATTSNVIPSPHPRGYMYGTNVSTLATAALPAAEQAAAEAGTLLPNDVTDENPSWGWSAGAALSTIGDLATWVTALVDGHLLNPEWQRRRLASVQSTDPTNPDAAGYGWAIARFGPMYGHTGELPGFQSFAGRDPDQRITLVVWANLNSAPDGRPVATTIARDLLATIYG